MTAILYQSHGVMWWWGFGKIWVTGGPIFTSERKKNTPEIVYNF